ncbi:hypothetical protein BVC80_747g20 [Macleaya cordata]|uniref:Uncharacterized protein n=1 Tax=Macleaya cordata TaxID=56857 RepID=A0A200QN43_MACCD|nr:hypothetical protein BVC80_747g20 [Macleaya cordata]
MFIDFVTKNVSPSKVDNFTIMLGVATPPAAMALKRTGESLPQLKMLKLVPDVIFVPSATLITLISMKLTRRATQRRHMTEALDVGTKIDQA